ncbi:T6SS phospholipase effector Tle1-like catalytic domain-containing protein [Sporobolomyces koalae]|uniref:T6SS phospholipase effector Tle1-like catalytic domain-containing protein n=1 Tax=Sporobolomyces koalae TaxID=500713 RepID=UPI00317EB49F
MRRLVVCCDGSWQSAYFQDNPRKLTNIARICNAICRQDDRQAKPIEQVKLYLPGPGTGQSLLVGTVEVGLLFLGTRLDLAHPACMAKQGALGEGMVERCREAYYWLCQNYEAGDEIQLYGFSRGGYLARIVASVVCLVGLLDPLSSLSFLPDVFSLLCSNRDITTKSGRRRHDELRQLLDSHKIKSRRNAQIKASRNGFLVQVLALFEAVPQIDPHHNPFSLPDCELEAEIERAYQALAISEDRPSYSPVILTRNPRVPEQELLQVWFPGSHSDVGGGVAEHDLPDLSLNWLVAHVAARLALNLDFISNLSAKATAPWGSHEMHLGLGRSLRHKPRQIPHSTDNLTCQHFHPSLCEQDPLSIPPDIRPILHHADHPLFVSLTALEQQRKDDWPFRSDSPQSPSLPSSNQIPRLDSHRAAIEASPMFHASVRAQVRVTVVHSSAKHDRSRTRFERMFAVERGIVDSWSDYVTKARGAGDLALNRASLARALSDSV